ncbi:Na/Pi cotransporter family protein [Ruegeria sediminis]|uniref:Na/Pi cotransporter family protein n=1 Tax=Ruegeria sediminis TaxID=2583820 RepID=A0ABY2WWZ1_9RHOB|nr:Na/Pi cotransporter family protein [Ruegeria sediminis]TMV07248.1 Na/Pi cotransporter family protein [Ruegeria sediminis]
MTVELDQYALISGLVGGLALFLLGLDILTRSLKQVAGDYMKHLLARFTENRFFGLITGAAVTAIIQSSSITTVLLVGFISAGLMTTAQSVAVILGANIGTTITAQVLAFKVTQLAMPLLALGFFTSFVAQRQETREYGRILLGLGLVFFGMAIMSETMAPLQSYRPFFDFMQSLENPMTAALTGAIFTAVVQSSSATTGILVVMAGQGLIGLETAIALALGANVGTCVTALLAAIGKPPEAVRAAVVHTLFNLAGVVIWIGFVGQLADLSRLISPAYPDLAPALRGPAEVPRQLANAHTLFNVANALLFIGFTRQITRLVEWMVPDRPDKTPPSFAPRHLDPQLLSVPAIALDAVRLEVLHQGEQVRDMLAAAVPTVTSGSPLQIDRLQVMDRPVDLLHREIIAYLRQISLGSLSVEQSDLLMALARISNDLEHIGDHVATGLVTSARKRIDENVVISPQTEAVIAGLHAKVLEAFDGSLLALKQQDSSLAAKVRKMKPEFAAMIEQIARHQVDRLRIEAPKRQHTYAREIELTETLDDIFKITRRIARTQIAVFDKPATQSA